MFFSDTFRFRCRPGFGDWGMSRPSKCNRRAKVGDTAVLAKNEGLLQ
jgi:hypothetical protein